MEITLNQFKELISGMTDKQLDNTFIPYNGILVSSRQYLKILEGKKREGFKTFEFKNEDTPREI